MSLFSRNAAQPGSSNSDTQTKSCSALPVKRSPVRYHAAMAVRALRGATKLRKDDPEEMREAVVELLREMFARNGVSTDDLISILFTSTPDLRSAFPAAAARELPLGDVPLMCASELDIPGALSMVVRVLAHTETDRSRAELSHVYLRGAEVLRLDLAQ